MKVRKKLEFLSKTWLFRLNVCGKCVLNGCFIVGQEKIIGFDNNFELILLRLDSGILWKWQVWEKFEKNGLKL